MDSFETVMTGALQLSAMTCFLCAAARNDVTLGGRLIAAGLFCGVASRFVALLL